MRVLWCEVPEVVVPVTDALFSCSLLTPTFNFGAFGFAYKYLYLSTIFMVWVHMKLHKIM
jgi:hypothetical protein